MMKRDDMGLSATDLEWVWWWEERWRWKMKNARRMWWMLYEWWLAWNWSVMNGAVVVNDCEMSIAIDDKKKHSRSSLSIRSIDGNITLLRQRSILEKKMTRVILRSINGKKTDWWPRCHRQGLHPFIAEKFIEAITTVKWLCLIIELWKTRRASYSRTQECCRQW